MIGRLRGILIDKQPPDLLIDVSGVAYELQASMQTFYQLPPVGQEIILHTHFVVREDAQQLYGFHALSERTLFRALLKVNGVGPKLALTILSSISAEDFVRCVTDHDSASLVRLPGVGKKTAERLIIEMRDRLNAWQSVDNLGLPMTMNTMNSSKNNAQRDAISALIALGYKPQEASKVVHEMNNDTASSEELIRLALKRVNA